MADKKIKNTIKIEDENMLNENKLEQVNGGTGVLDIFETEEDEIDKLGKIYSSVSETGNRCPANARTKQFITLKYYQEINSSRSDQAI